MSELAPSGRLQMVVWYGCAWVCAPSQHANVFLQSVVALPQLYTDHVTIQPMGYLSLYVSTAPGFHSAVYSLWVIPWYQGILHCVVDRVSCREQ